MAEEKTSINDIKRVSIDSIAVILEVFPHEHLSSLLRLLIKDHDYPVVTLLATSIDREQWQVIEDKASKILRSVRPGPYAPNIDAEKVDKLLANKDEEIEKLKIELEKAQSRASGLTDLLGERDRALETSKLYVEEAHGAKVLAEARVKILERQQRTGRPSPR